jgi:DNA-binding transcriptional MerR regulator
MTTYGPAEAAERSGFSIDTLRYYEREGILPPVARSSAGRRQYSDGDLAMLDFLRCLRDTGMPIERLRRYGELARSDETMPERLALIEEHSAVVEQQIAELERQRARLEEKAAWYREQLDGSDSRSA